MKYLTKPVALSALAAVLILSSQTSALANPGSPVPSNKQQVGPLAGLVLHKLTSTVASNGGGGGALTPGYNHINTVSVSCTRTAGCFFGIESMVQVNIPVGTLWAICPSVDGNYASPPCPFQAPAAAAAGYVTGNGRSTIAVAQGAHTVNVDVYLNNAATLANWESDVRVYGP